MVRSSNLEGCHTFHDMMRILMMVDDVGDEQAAKVVTIAWALWNNWNVVRHGGEKKNGKALVQWAMNYIMEYNEAVAVSKESTQVAELADPWRPPQPSWYKVNVDGAVFSAQKAVGASVLIRDDKGRVEAALSKKIMAPMGAVEVEVTTFEAGMLLAKDTGVEDLVLEGDSVMVLNALSGKSTPPSSVEAAVLGMQEMAKDFRRIVFSHVRRQSNKPAHLLAKHASGISNYLVWSKEYPFFIEQALTHDVNSISYMQ